MLEIRETAPAVGTDALTRQELEEFFQVDLGVHIVVIRPVDLRLEVRQRA